MSQENVEIVRRIHGINEVPAAARTQPRHSGIPVLVAVALLLALAPFASGSIQFERQWGSQGSGNGQFNNPVGVATDSAGNVYVADAGNDRIQKFDSSGSFITKWGSQGTREGQFGSPNGVATDSAGNVYVTDTVRSRIQKFDSSGNFLRMWGWGVNDGSNAFQICTSSCQAGINGTGNGQFGYPEGIATDSAGNVYVGDNDEDGVNSRIQKFASSGTFITKWGSTGSGNGQFHSPILGVATDSAGQVYAADAGNIRIQKFASSGAFITKWGSLGSGEGQFNSPSGVATDSAGNVYVADNGADVNRSRIQKFDPSGAFITKWGSFGSGEGQFNSPSGVATDSAGNVYVTEFGNSRIQKFRQETQTTINSGPSDLTNDASPSFAFSSDEPGSSFECRLDSNQEADFQSCSSPKPYSSLGDGSHIFEVRANSPAGYSGPPASRSFTVDTAPPDTTITDGPSGGTNDPTPTFTFSSSEAGSTFECRFDSDAFAPCSGPGATHTPSTSLSDSSHTFEVRAADPAGNTDPSPASRTFTVDTAPPDTTITGGPGSTHDPPPNDPTPTFTFSSSQAGSSFSCKVDSGAYTPCSSPKTLAHLPDSSHAFYVRATDPAGNTDPTPAERHFTVQTAAVFVSGTTLNVKANFGAEDNIRITRPSASILRVTDFPSGPYAGSGVHTGAGCTRVGDYTANCTGEIAQIRVDAGERPDQVTNATGVSSSLNGGSRSDRLTGGPGRDSLIGGPGADVMLGMNGNDQLFGRDLTDDTTINCDGGIGTPGSADKADLDLLPKDSPVSGCETVTRH